MTISSAVFLKILTSEWVLLNWSIIIRRKNRRINQKLSLSQNHNNRVQRRIVRSIKVHSSLSKGPLDHHHQLSNTVWHPLYQWGLNLKIMRPYHYQTSPSFKLALMMLWKNGNRLKSKRNLRQFLKSPRMTCPTMKAINKTRSPLRRSITTMTSWRTTLWICVS